VWPAILNFGIRIADNLGASGLTFVWKPMTVFSTG